MYETRCGGSIVDLSHIVTAGHCAFNPATEARMSAESFVVLAGASVVSLQEIEDGATVQARLVEAVRIHPDYDYAAGAGASDDVAVLQLAAPLGSSSGVSSISLPSSTSSPTEGTSVVLDGFGEENPSTGELNGKLYSLGMVLGFARRCGGEADAVFLCASAPDGSGCLGDSGSGLTSGNPSVLVGVMDTVEVVSGKPCPTGGDNGFVNVAAPEIRDFIEGSESPPQAPRGGGSAIRGVTTVAHALTCEPGSWSGSPTFTYAFIDSSSGQILQIGASPSYQLSAADVGRAILCEVQATNDGGTGVGSTQALPAIEAASGGSQPTGGGSGTLPGAIEPPPVNPRIEKEFEEHPPWDQPTTSAPTVPPSATAATSGVTLIGATLEVQSAGTTSVRLACRGSATCSGRLDLVVKAPAKRKAAMKSSDATTIIASARFSIPVGQTTTVKLTLKADGRALLLASHDHLSARLTIVQLEPETISSQTKSVSLALQRKTSKK